MVKIKTFDECLASVGAGNKHLLIGNGFSIDLFPEIFNYKTLSENIKSDQISQLFEAIDTPDFEFVMRRLFETAEIVIHYDSSGSIVEAIRADIEELKTTLIQVITKAHPALPSTITDEQYLSCRQFLSHFEGKKYTFNYDLILYWVYMHFRENPKLKLACNDGFSFNPVDNPEEQDFSLHWEIGREQTQNIYYIHGAMHIFSNGSDIEKLSYRQIGLPLAEQVKVAIDEDKYPVFISEGTKDHKLARIKGNGYLSRTFSSLKNIRGNLFIHGHSLRDEDDHIFDFINQNNTGLKKVFVGMFGDATEKHNRIIIRKVQRWIEAYPGRTYEFYDSVSAKVWNRTF